MRKKDIKHFGKKHLFSGTAIQSVEAVEWPLQVVTSISSYPVLVFKVLRLSRTPGYADSGVCK